MVSGEGCVVMVWRGGQGEISDGLGARERDEEQGEVMSKGEV